MFSSRIKTEMVSKNSNRSLSHRMSLCSLRSSNKCTLNNMLLMYSHCYQVSDGCRLKVTDVLPKQFVKYGYTTELSRCIDELGVDGEDDDEEEDSLLFTISSLTM